MLLPARLLLRRADEAPVIGAALTAAARGPGHRRVARELGVPEDTVRGWLRRAAGRAGQVREVFTKVAAAVSADPVPLEPAGSPLADALVAVAAAAAAAVERWPRLLAVSPWEIASAVTNATLLAPGWPPGCSTRVPSRERLSLTVTLGAACVRGRRYPEEDRQ
jgi:hypothetical protein